MSVILLDLDDTLVPDVLARDRALEATLTALADSPVPTAQALGVIRGAWRSSGLRDVPELTGVSSWEALWTDFDAAVVDPSVQTAGRQFQAIAWAGVGINGAADGRRASRMFVHNREALLEPYAWVVPTLNRWRSRHQLWCATNGSGWLQRRKLERAGLDRFLERVFTSGDLGATKSEPAFHDHVARALLDDRKRATAVIGDNASTDGALALSLDVDFVPVSPGDPPAWGR